jgi:hypothetical protein
MATRDPGRLAAARGLLVLATVLALVAVGCGGDDDDVTSTPGPDTSTSAPGTVTSTSAPTDDTEASGTTDPQLSAQFEQVGQSLRITWTVTNPTDTELVAFDNRRPDETADAERYGSYVTGKGRDTAEIGRRLFPVPDDLEGFAAYGVNATSVPPHGELGGKEIVLLPLEYTPAAHEGGGDPLPDHPTQAIFCVGVGDAAKFPTSASESAPAGYRFVRHTADNVALQTLLCSDPFALPG